MRRKTRTISDSDLRDLLINPKLNRKGQYVCDCIFCGKERHMYVSKQTQLFDCKKCGEYEEGMIVTVNGKKRTI